MRYMEQETKEANKPMFWIGIAMTVIAAIIFLSAREELGMWPIPFGIIGIVFIGASRYRLMKK
jgi:hypothetical protein